ncbi:hypothetical protein F5Y12DRAFT_226896 [Xylaria sp. FL1777]|nr:hypothetical protein F5Y12DRAFT_226896 [Xylaria sp. FL1777]
MDEDHIDSLLERYLHLLHEYTCLREELTALQTGMYQDLARANFAAERGMRFGQDYYDDRMQASRRLAISYNSQETAQDKGQDPSSSQDRRNPVVFGSPVTSFTITSPAAVRAAAATKAGDSEANVEAPDPNLNPPNPDSGPEAGAEAEPTEQSTMKSTNKSTNKEGRSAPTPPATAAQPSRDTAGNATGERADSSRPPPIAEKGSGPGPGPATATPQKPKDPLRWFGLLAPMPLRQAQTQSIRAVEHVIPRLASLDAEMAAVEIEVRRARKRRAKAETAAAAATSRLS